VKIETAMPYKYVLCYRCILNVTLYKSIFSWYRNCYFCHKNNITAMKMAIAMQRFMILFDVNG